MGHINKPSFKKLQKVASPTRIYVAASQPGSESNANKFNIPVDPHHEEQNIPRFWQELFNTSKENDVSTIHRYNPSQR